MTPYLAPIENPKGMRLKMLYRFLGKAFGKPPAWLTVQGARMPVTFLMWMGKVSSLSKKLVLPDDMERLIRARVDNLNMCTWCQDAGRWYVMTKDKDDKLLAKVDAVDEYRTSPLFSDTERAALDFATELTEQKHVGSETFNTLRQHFSEREICEIDWVVATNHLFNINNLGLGISSDGLCELAKPKLTAAQAG
ncbi:MAG: carboxymuconolactone decarboxylase family protein [Propionibacteriales bacterium]|nr:carboxymuconolactone decarboxylase family protein [Propionibacteriales bacterium]